MSNTANHNESDAHQWAIAEHLDTLPPDHETILVIQDHAKNNNHHGMVEHVHKMAKAIGLPVSAASAVFIAAWLVKEAL